MSSPSPAPSPAATKLKNKKRKESTYDDVYASYDLSEHMLFLFPIGIFAALVAWWKNSNSNIIMRVIYVMIAYVLNIFYLLYSVYRWWTYRPPIAAQVST